MTEERPSILFNKAAIVAGFFSGMAAVFLFVALPRPAVAASYGAAKMIQSPAPVVVAGGTARFSVGFKNTGTETWKNSGANFVSAYTWDPKYRASPFQDASWRSFRQPAALKNQSVAPGQIGYIEFTLRAPTTPGTYKETFNLAAEDLLWIPGGEFSVTITVAAGTAAAAPAPSPAPAPAVVVPTPTPSLAGQPYAAQRMVQSAPALGMKPGETKEFQIWHKNIGTATWNGWTLQVNDSPLGIATSGSGTLAFQDVTWSASDCSLPTRLAIGWMSPLTSHLRLNLPMERFSGASKSARSPRFHTTKALTDMW